MRKVTFYQINAFSDDAFCGNPAVIYVNCENLSSLERQWIAQEHKISATAFLDYLEDQYVLSSYSPDGSLIEFCGHATLAAVSILFRENSESSEFNLQSGKVDVVANKWNDGFIALTLPSMDYQELSIDKLPFEISLNREVLAYYLGNQTMVLRFNSEADVLNFKPDVDLLRLKKWFLSVTAPGNKVDFVSRYFGPSTGIDEDAVTGSVHCLLARIWGDILGRKDMTALQLSKRSGLLRLAITNDSRTLRLMGKCFLTVQGTRFLGG